MTRNKKMELAIVAAALIGVFLVVAQANALDIKAARNALAVPGGAGIELFTFSGASPTDIPSGVLLWSGDGSAFWIRRSLTATTWEDVEIKIPEGASLVIPLQGAYKTSGIWYQRLEVGTALVAASDSVFCLPVLE